MVQVGDWFCGVAVRKSAGRWPGLHYRNQTKEFSLLSAMFENGSTDGLQITPRPSNYYSRICVAEGPAPLRLPPTGTE